MFQVMPESAGNIMGVRATGKLTDRDYQYLIPNLEALITKYGKVRFLCFMDEEFAGWDAGAFWDDAKFFLPHRADFEKMALVGGPKWVELSMKFFGPLLQGDYQTFSGDQLAAAWEWIKS